MRIRRSVTLFFLASVVPAIAIAVTAYFGYYAVGGPRGLVMLANTNSALSAQDAKLANLEQSRLRLQHRIDLLAYGHADPDLVEEIARQQMLASSPDEVVIPRSH